MNNLPDDFRNKTTKAILLQAKAKIRKEGYYSDGHEFKFGRIVFYETARDPEMRLQCKYVYYKCNAAIQLTRRGCIEYLCEISHSWPNAKIMIQHDIAKHSVNTEKTLLKSRGRSKKVTDEEITKYIIEDRLRQSKIMEIIGKRVEKADLRKLRNRVQRLIAIYKGSQTTKDCIDTTTDITLNEVDTPFCRSQMEFQTEDKLGRAIIFGAREQLYLLTKADLVAVDGFFKFRIKGFEQLLTFAVFLKNIYVPICHILLTDKKTTTYNQAFYQFLALVHNDTNNYVDWSTKTIISDYERGLSSAITNVIRPGTQNHCHFHYIKAIYDNFIQKVPKELRKDKKDFLKYLKVYPFTWIVEKSTKCSRELFIAACFYYHYGRCKEILPFFQYFKRNWVNEQFMFQENAKAVQRTTNGVETLHELYRQKGIVGVGRLDDLIDGMKETDSSIYDAFVNADLRGIINNEFNWRSVSGAKIVTETKKMVVTTLNQFESLYKSHPRFYFDDLNDLEQQLLRIDQGEPEFEEIEDNHHESDDEEIFDMNMDIDQDFSCEEEEEEEEDDLMRD